MKEEEKILVLHQKAKWYEMIDGDKWIGMAIEDIELTSHELIVMMKRNGEVFMPNGKTVITRKDTLIMYSSK